MQQFISVMHPGKPGLPESMTEQDRVHFGKHVSYLREKFEQGHIIFAGPSVEENEEHFAVVVLNANSKAEASALMDADPAVASGLLTSTVTAFEVFLSKKHYEPEVTPAAQICYVDIPAPNIEAAGTFYNDVFGWTITPSNLEAANYWEFSTDGGLSGGLVENRPAHRGGALLYLKVESIEKTLAHIQSSGGQILREKFVIGGGHGYSALFSDPNGNEMGLFSKC